MELHSKLVSCQRRKLNLNLERYKETISILPRSQRVWKYTENDKTTMPQITAIQTKVLSKKIMKTAFSLTRNNPPPHQKKKKSHVFFNTTRF